MLFLAVANAQDVGCVDSADQRLFFTVAKS
jgi:hypothetical protein